MKIYIGADHTGYKLKEELKKYFGELGYEVEDEGASKYETTDDYPDFIRPLAEAVAKDRGSRGIILGGSGQGEAMCANRVKGVRAAVHAYSMMRVSLRTWDLKSIPSALAAGRLTSI